MQLAIVDPESGLHSGGRAKWLHCVIAGKAETHGKRSWRHRNLFWLDQAATSRPFSLVGRSCGCENREKLDLRHQLSAWRHRKLLGDARVSVLGALEPLFKQHVYWQTGGGWVNVEAYDVPSRLDYGMSRQTTLGWGECTVVSCAPHVYSEPFARSTSWHLPVIYT
jgi:hypothetical protein